MTREMKTYRYLAILLTAGLLASCSSDSAQQEGQSPIISQTDEPVPVEFTVAAQRNYDFTRSESSIVTFNSGENVKVCVKPDGASSYTGYDFTTAEEGQTNVALNAPAGDDALKPYFPAGTGTTVQAYAYYPSTAADAATFSVADDQTSDAAYKASDLMYAADRTITKGSTDGTSLSMAHKMAQLKIYAHAQNGSGIIIKKVKVNAQKSVSFTPATGATTTTGDNGDIVALNGEGTGYVLVPVQTVNNVSIKIETDDAGTADLTATYGFTASGDFEAGSSYSIDLTVTADQIGTTTAIADWNGAGSLVIAPTGDLTISAIPAQTYTGSALEPTFTVSKDGEVLTKDATDGYTVQYLHNTNAGTAYAVVMGQGTYNGSVGVAAFIINKEAAAITYSTTSVSKTYGDAAFTNAHSNTGDGTVSYASSDTDVATVNASTGQVTIQNTGSAVITATVVDGDNYTYPTTTASYTLTVGKKSITTNDITLASQTLTYNAGSQTRNVASVGGLTDDNNWTVTNNTETNAGSYTLTVTMAETCKNYKGSSTASWTIGKRTLTITAKAQTINYGQSIATGIGQINYSGQVSGHSVTAITLSQNTANATTNGTITPSNATVKDGSSNTVTGNYAITYNTGTLNINKVAATLTCNTDAISFAATDAVNSTKTKTGVSCNGGTINVSSNNTNNCSVSISGSTITVTRKTTSAFTNTTITVSVTPDDNHTAPASKTFYVSAVSTWKSMTSATTSDIGKVICSNGHIHSSVSDVTCDDGSAQAMIAYVGNASECSHGLAIALSDASSSCFWTRAASTVTSWASSHSVSGGTWRLPSGDDWKYMFAACGGTAYNTTWTEGMSYSYGNFRTKLNALGSYDVQSSRYYWSSKEYDSGNAWAYTFNASRFDWIYKSDGRCVRTVLAF